MKFLFVVALFICLGSAVGLQCIQYVSKNGECISKKPVTRYSRQSKKYCATLTYVDASDGPQVLETCIAESKLAKSEPGFNVGITDIHPYGWKSTLVCCESLLCNNSNTLNNGSILFVAVLFGCFNSDAGLLFS